MYSGKQIAYVGKRLGNSGVDGCWNWQGTIKPNGYGQVRLNYKVQYAHRVVYQLFVQPIPEGMVIDHLCKNKACVRPTHLDLTTQKENVRRGNLASVARAMRAAVTHCPQGHAYDEQNTYMYGRNRQCRACHRDRARVRRERRRED